jgi:hypothetical protein
MVVARLPLPFTCTFPLACKTAAGVSQLFAPVHTVPLLGVLTGKYYYSPTFMGAGIFVKVG